MAEEDQEQNGNAEDGKAEGAESEGSEKKKGRKKVLIIVIVLIVDIAVMAGVAFLIVNAVKGEYPAVTAMKEEEEARKKAENMITQMGTVLESPYELTVNVGTTGGEKNYLKCAVNIEWDAITYPLLQPEIERREAKIKHIIIKTLSAETVASLMTAQGKERVRNDMVTDINTILPKDAGQIRSAFFTDFLIQ